MIQAIRRKFLAPTLIVALGVVLYATILQSAVPGDLPDDRHTFSVVRAGQIEGPVLGTFFYSQICQPPLSLVR